MLRKAHLKFAAMPYDGQFGFQKPYSPIMEGIISFHDDLVIFLTFILFFVIYMLGMAIYLFNYKKNNNIAEGATFTHNSTLEII
jgi:cytochrome c oxidase subunit 2